MPRPKGSLNKRSNALLAKIKQQFPNYDPIMHMAEVAADKTKDPNMRLAASKEISQYVYPKLKAVDMSIEGKLAVSVGVREITDEEWTALSHLNHEALDAEPDETE